MRPRRGANLSRPYPVFPAKKKALIGDVKVVFISKNGRKVRLR